MNEITEKEQVKNAIKWIEALLSGKYKQGKILLRSNGKYCCWGVGCELMKIPITPMQSWSDEFALYIGFKISDGYIKPDFYGKNTLAGVNDQTNAGFKRIAKYLIKHAATNFDYHVAKGITKHFSK